MSLNMKFLSKRKKWIAEQMPEGSQQCLLQKGVSAAIHNSIPHMSISPREDGDGIERNTGRSQGREDSEFPLFNIQIPESQLKPHCYNCFIHCLHTHTHTHSLQGGSSQWLSIELSRQL